MEARIVFLASVLALGIAAQWLAWRLRLPAILLLLAFGFAAGFAIDAEELVPRDVLFPIVSLSVAVILFEGGLSLRLNELQGGGRVIIRLVTLAILITWLLSALAAWALLGFDPRMAMLLGAILVVSGPTVIVPLLRHVRPVGRIGSIAKWEGIVNDPVGAVLAVLVLEAVLLGFDQAASSAVFGLISTIAIGGGGGALAAFVVIGLLRRYWVPDYLHSAVTLAVVLMAYTLSNLLQRESGLVTVTVLGLVLANQKAVTIRHVIEFKENLRVLLISALFILLASRVKMEQIVAVGWQGVAFLAVLIVLVRPLAVFVSTLGSELTRGEKTFLAWIHPRGIVAAAVSALFALELVAAGEAGALRPEIAQQAEQLAPITFVVIVGTVTVYGLTLAPLASALGLSRQNPQGVLFAGAAAWVREVAAALHDEGFQVVLVDTNYPNIQTARMAGLPTCYASVLSEFVNQELELGEIGRLLAMTPNDEINALASIEYAEDFGRAEVYQLPTGKIEGNRHTPRAETRPGRDLFAPDATYSGLARRFAEGDQVKKTRLTDDFTYDEFRTLYGPDALVLFVFDDAGKLAISTVDKPLSPASGQTVIALVRPLDEEPVDSAAKQSAE